MPFSLPLGFRIVGSCSEPRRLVDAGAAFAAYAACDTRAETGRESYLSAFRFDEDFRRHLADTGSTAEFAGACWSPWLWFDLDAEGDLPRAQAEAEGLAEVLTARYAVPADALLLFFSGSKGFHAGLPTALWSPEPSAEFHRIARRFAEHVAELAGVTIDTGVYDRVRAFRAPNSRHPKTGLHKRRLTLAELSGPLADILELAKTPAPFDLPPTPAANDQAAADWEAAAERVAIEAEAKAARRAAGGMPTLNRSTLEFIRDGAAAGDRHRRLFSAAANLGELGCPPALALALLEEAGLDCGLPPKEVRRQIDCGLAAVGAAETHQDAPGTPLDAADGSIVAEPSERDTRDSGGSERQSCQQLTTATEAAPAAESTPPADITAALTKLWNTPPAPAPVADQDAATAPPRFAADRSPAVLPPDPPRLVPLPPRAVGSGTRVKPCRCGSREFVDSAISEGRTRRDCRRCGKFLGFSRWYGEGGVT